MDKHNDKPQSATGYMIDGRHATKDQYEKYLRDKTKLSSSVPKQPPAPRQ